MVFFCNPYVVLSFLFCLSFCRNTKLEIEIEIQVLLPQMFPYHTLPFLCSVLWQSRRSSVCLYLPVMFYMQQCFQFRSSSFTTRHGLWLAFTPWCFQLRISHNKCVGCCVGFHLRIKLFVFLPQKIFRYMLHFNTWCKWGMTDRFSWEKHLLSLFIRLCPNKMPALWWMPSYVVFVCNCVCCKSFI